MAPTIDVIAGEYAGKVKVGKVDVDANGATAMRYNVRGIPTLLLFKGGQVVEQRVGAIGKAERFIRTCLSERAYARSYRTSVARASALPDFLRYYNERRFHIGSNGVACLTP